MTQLPALFRYYLLLFYCLLLCYCPTLVTWSYTYTHTYTYTYTYIYTYTYTYTYTYINTYTYTCTYTYTYIYICIYIIYIYIYILLYNRILLFCAVVASSYVAAVRDAHVTPGNVAVLTCVLPAHVTDYVTVTSWVLGDAATDVVTLAGDINILSLYYS